MMSKTPQQVMLPAMDAGGVHVPFIHQPWSMSYCFFPSGDPLPLTIALVDTETTGGFSTTHRLIEIAIVLLAVDPQTGQVSERLAVYEGLQDPGFPIPWQATAIHGITNAMVRHCNIDTTRVTALLRCADLVIAHNCSFDKHFVAQVMPEAHHLPWACSCRGIPWRTLFPHLPNAKLQGLAQAFAIPPGRAHRALADVETTLALLMLPHPTEPVTLLGHLLFKKGLSQPLLPCSGDLALAPQKAMPAKANNPKSRRI